MTLIFRLEGIRIEIPAQNISTSDGRVIFLSNGVERVESLTNLIGVIW